MKQIEAEILVLKAGINKLPNVLLADGKTLAPKETIEMVLAGYIECYQKKNYVLKPDVDELAKTLDKKSFSGEIIALYNGWASNKQKYNLLPLIFRFCSGEIISKIYHDLIDDKRLQDVVSNCLLLSDTREAIMLADKAGILKEYADIRNMTEDEIRSRELYDYGFNSDGKIVYNLGNKDVEVSLNKDFSLTIVDLSKGKILKSIPKQGVDPELYKKAVDSFAEIKKTIKKAAKSVANNLFSQFLSGIEKPVEDWQSMFMNNPLLRIMAELVVWGQGDETFIVRNKETIRYDGTPYKLKAQGIKAAHPIEMDQSELDEWRQYFIDNQLKQPFEQVWEPNYTLEKIELDRYAGVEIPLYRFLNQEKHGIKAERSFDYYECFVTFEFKDCKVEIDCEDNDAENSINNLYVIQSFSFEKFTRQVNHIIAYLDKITIYDKIIKDDISIEKLLYGLNLAQILEFIDFATKNKSVNVVSMLLNYKNEHFSDAMDEFILEF